MGMSKEARQQAIERAVQAYSERPAVGGAINLPYKDGSDGPFIVVKLPVQAVVFNPKSHRIKAQLESHEKSTVIKNDPFSDEAQGVIYEILTATEGFKSLKANLKEYGQQDPGVVTRDGLLVNGNNRLAALRDINPNGYIDAALLPSDADEHSIDRLELELQVRRNFKQPYTFTNELIFINELLSIHNYSEEDAAKALNWAASGDEAELRKGIVRVRQSVRIYATVRSIQEMSGWTIPLTFFDKEKQILIDLDSSYEAMKDKNPEGAERQKEGRILSLLAGTDYRDARKITSESMTATLVPKLDDAETLTTDLETLTTETKADQTDEDDDVDILGGREGNAENGHDKTLRPLVEVVAKSFGKGEVQLPSGKQVSRNKMIEEIAEAIEDTAEAVQETDNASKSLKGPLRSLDDAIKKIKDATLGFQKVKSVDGFDYTGFKERLASTSTQFEALEQAIRNHEAE